MSRLSSFLFILLLPLSSGAESPIKAFRQLSEYYYKDSYLREQVKGYERQYVPRIIQDYKTPLAIVLRLAIEGRLSGTWSFP